MPQSKGTYPIVKYPKNIERKLKNRSKVVAAPKIDIDEDAFAHLFPPLLPQKAKRYPQYVLWGIMSLWVFMLAGVVLKVVSGGVLVAAAVASAVALGFAGKQLWADSKIAAVRADRSKAQIGRAHV